MHPSYQTAQNKARATFLCRRQKTRSTRPKTFLWFYLSFDLFPRLHPREKGRLLFTEPKYFRSAVSLWPQLWLEGDRDRESCGNPPIEISAFDAEFGLIMKSSAICASRCQREDFFHFHGQSTINETQGMGRISRVCIAPQALQKIVRETCTI
ncbi:hypothetical protein BOTBODRAFT_238981 [Botryobasidium botryosum FD-172 SS1]|uniref:Uncharacterized protein n=1 Tax=Botryobasidium botryosum (strain FD-172 SS1) TaxID=930990 RepID=A0A067MMF3_BOTB1|nr:hypothetical protein BOTBODRAFT_238981 [Botryobasidium botryosum FD-172 SS1]